MNQFNDLTDSNAFWEAFQKGLQKRIDSSPQWVETYYDAAKWTQFMTALMSEIGTENGYNERGEVAYEYFRVDVIFSKWRSQRNGWDLHVAIELENNPKTWFDEFVKLCHINAGLRVIVTYDDYRSPLESQIDQALKLFKDQKYKSLLNNWLLIFGPTGDAEKVRREKWVAFAIQNDAVKRI